MSATPSLRRAAGLRDTPAGRAQGRHAIGKAGKETRQADRLIEPSGRVLALAENPEGSAEDAGSDGDDREIEFDLCNDRLPRERR